MKILLPIDIAHSQQPNIDQLGKVIKLKDSEVCLLFVKEDLPSYENVVETMGDFAEDWNHKVDQKAKESFAQAETLLKSAGANPSHQIVSGPPAMMIEAVARDEDCDLTVMTSGKRTQVESFFLGSVSGKVVKHGPEATLILRSGDISGAHLTKVLFATDGSDHAELALETGLNVLNIDKETTAFSVIHVVNVAEVFKMFSPVEFISIIENNMLLEGETYLADAKAFLSESGIKNIDCALKEGDPSTEILNYAKETKADVIVIGAQGRTAVEHFLMGSVSHRIAMHAKSSTLVVKISEI